MCNKNETRFYDFSIIDTINGVNTPLPWERMYWECLFNLYWKIPLNENLPVDYDLLSEDTVLNSTQWARTWLASKTPTNSLWKLKFNSALILSIYMVSDDSLPFVPNLVSLSLFSLVAKSVKVNGLSIFLVVAIVVDRPEMDVTFMAGLFYSFVFFTVRVKN